MIKNEYEDEMISCSSVSNVDTKVQCANNPNDPDDLIEPHVHRSPKTLTPPKVISEQNITVHGKNHGRTELGTEQNQDSIQGLSTHRNQNKMTVWFVLGPIGAGKSSFIATILKTHDLVYLSADIVQRERKLSYADTRNLMEKIIKEHIDNKISFIIEGTGQHDDLYDLFVDYRKSGINLKVTFIDVDLDVALRRNKSRTRVLEDETVRNVYRRCMERRHRWKEFGCTYISYKDILSESHNYSAVY